MKTIIVPALSTLLGVFQGRALLHLEILALRQQLAMVKHTSPKRLRFHWRERLFWVWLYRLWPGCLQTLHTSHRKGSFYQRNVTARRLILLARSPIHGASPMPRLRFWFLVGTNYNADHGPFVCNKPMLKTFGLIVNILAPSPVIARTKPQSETTSSLSRWEVALRSPSHDVFVSSSVSSPVLLHWLPLLCLSILTGLPWFLSFFMPLVDSLPFLVRSR